MGARAGKYKLGARAGKHKLGARAGKYKLGARAGRHKLGARARGQVKCQGPGKTNTHVCYGNWAKNSVIFLNSKIAK